MLLKWDPKSKIDLPSDIDGKFYSTVSKTGQKKLNLERIITDFEKILSNYMDDRLGKLASTKYNDIDVYYDKALSVQLQNPTPDASWGTKALYLGSKSADLWTKMEERSYAESSAIDKFLKTATWKDGKKKRSIKDLAIDNIISFGPGAGTIDKNLISYFTKDSFKPFYIPIDISISLITRAIDRIGTKASYPVPFAILDDFEQGTCFDRLGDLIKSNEHKIHKQSLFSILGVTFSNYSQPESEFLKAIARLMREKEDYLLLDVVAGIPPEGGAFVRRVRNQLTGRRLQELIVHSIRKRYPNLRGADDNELVNNVKIVKQSAESDRYHVLTKLNKTQIVEYVYNDGTNDVPLLTLKAYDYGEFKDSLTEFFDIQACSLDTKYKRGIFLLSKKIV